MAPGILIEDTPEESALYEEAPVLPLPQLPDDYGYTYDHRNGYVPESLEETTAYKVAEHILWAPRKIRVASIGAGAAGIMLCYKKEKEFGDDIDLVVYDRYDSCGGVWHANKYPGCRCDVPSPAYQFSFAPSAEWPRYYSSAEDIKKYYHGFAESHGYLEKYIRLRHEITSATWLENEGQWLLNIKHTLSDGSVVRKQDRVEFLIANIGVLNTWRWPNIPDRELFTGAITHSAAYDTSIDLDNKRVAVIGSGASSIQIIPAIQPRVKELVSFYRTPQWISSGLGVAGYTDPEGKNFTFSDEQKAQFRDDPEYYLKFRKAMEQQINSSFRHNLKDHLWQQKGREMTSERMRKLLKDDPRLVKRLVPDFPMGCRRLGPAEGFLEAMQEPNVTLPESAIKAFTKNVDVIICATGFDVSFKPYFPINGRGGQSLAKQWDKDPAAYLAMGAPGFPNFMVGSLGPNCPAGHGSFVTVLEAAQNYICKLIRKLQTENIKSLDVKHDAVQEYNEHIHEWLKRTVWTAGCRSWYNQGQAGGKVTAQYPGSLVHWKKILEEPRYEDFDIKYRGRNRFQFMGNGFTKEEVTGEDLRLSLLLRLDQPSSQLVDDATTSTSRPLVAGNVFEDEDDSVDRPGKEGEKSARKRARDRVAQQEHRKRQKVYVEQLEAKIESMIKHSSSSDFTALMQENEALRNEVKRLRGFFDGVQALVQAQEPSSPPAGAVVDTSNFDNSGDVGHSSLQQHANVAMNCGVDGTLRAGNSELTPPQCSSEDIEQDELNEATACMYPTLVSNATEYDSSAAFGTLSVPLHMQAHSSTVMTNQEQPSQHAFARWPNTDTHDTRVSRSIRVPTPLSMLDFSAGWPELLPWFQSPARSQGPYAYGTGNLAPGTEALQDASQFSQPFAHTRMSSQQQGEQFPHLPHHLRLPSLLGHLASTDAILLEFLRLPDHGLIHAGGSRLPRPSIKDFILNNSPNGLSSRIKSYIAPFSRNERIPETLASYWIITLFTRWYINKDQESYNDMPAWLRPTKLQQSMSHAMTLSFMPWPGIRDAAIAASLSSPAMVEDIMVTLGQFMEVDLSCAYSQAGLNTADHASFNGSGNNGHDLLTQILVRPDSSNVLDTAIKDLRNWTLRDGFFARYPQWRSLYVVPRDQLYPPPATDQGFAVDSMHPGLALLV
ncbi:putative sterigmatocystin biosynthesis monooxygenase stcW [Cyphellophora attinorum]|uniref:Putative sterigmatocystin biosynthesis monooxygenase stcW n=1 Tax=Cyphellophora attinorum TaxID=1664694 RepID=A0A0N0NJC3_9EURO|nr:putative sterigmatocystin biosynthesis monooxygenase stcW [Phialophora attinorum]KPI36748.1 putative sterigmatocystin biosynthesis monooxygenase stcW [Phialophora attinorum]